MAIKASEISDLIKAAHRAVRERLTEARDEGTVVSVTDGIVRVHGLGQRRQYGEMLDFPARTPSASRSTSSGIRSARWCSASTSHISEGEHGQAPRAASSRSRSARRTARTGREPPRRADRRQGPDQ